MTTRLIGAGLLACWLALGLPASAQVPATVSYQGHLASGGQPVNATLQMTFSLYAAASGGSPLWTEVQTVPVSNGLFQVMLGSVTPFTVDFSAPYFLGISVGTDGEMTPRQVLASTPYSMRAGCNPGDRVSCYTANIATLGGSCAAGTRTCSPTGLGWGPCVGEVTPNCGGQCANLQTDLAHCGSCNNACPVPNHATATCANGSCGFACTAGFQDCNALPGDGCEIDTNATVSHCGGCNQQCAVANGTPACASGTCVIQACNSGFQDCNANLADGCETHTDTTLAHCGACNQPCSTANGVPQCVSGQCSVSSCTSGYSNCNGNGADGCECNTPLCCGGSCGVAHQNCSGAGCGPLGQTFYNCLSRGTPGDAGTYSLTLAQEAAAAWPVGGTASAGSCGGSTWYKNTGTECAVWQYTGALAGYVRYNAGACTCPTGSDPTWN